MYVYKLPEQSELLHQRALLNSELESIFKPAQTSPATPVTVTGASLMPRAVKDFNNPDYEKQQWCISQVAIKGRAPMCANCSRQFQKEELSVQVMAWWVPPHKTGDGKKFTLDRKYHFCLKWSCLENSPPMFNLLALPGNIKVDEEIAATLSSEEYQTIFSENLPMERLKY